MFVTISSDVSRLLLTFPSAKYITLFKISENALWKLLVGSSALARAYLTNGMGAIDEKDMPYVDSNELINISEIKNKKVKVKGKRKWICQIN